MSNGDKNELPEPENIADLAMDPESDPDVLGFNSSTDDLDDNKLRAVLDYKGIGIRTSILVDTSFRALHYWPDQPDGVQLPALKDATESEGVPLADIITNRYLRHPHRHTFKVKVICSVGHNDRQIEFFELQHLVDIICSSWSDGGPYTASCELFALSILTQLVLYDVPVSAVGVYEDGENGAMVYAHDKL